MEIMRIVGIGILGAAAAVLLRQYRSEFGMLVSLACCIVLLFAVAERLGQAAQTVNRLLEQGGIGRAQSGILFRSLGLCLMTQIAADSCRDSGENAIASKIEFAGKLAVLALSLPLFEEILSIAAGLLSL